LLYLRRNLSLRSVNAPTITVSAPAAESASSSGAARTTANAAWATQSEQDPTTTNPWVTRRRIVASLLPNRLTPRTRDIPHASRALGEGGALLLRRSNRSGCLPELALCEGEDRAV